MLLRALDWHPDILMFPREVTHLAVLYFEGGWSEPNKGIKELTFSDAAWLDNFRKVFHPDEPELFDYYGVFRSESFREAYESVMARQELEPLLRFHTALADALRAGSPRERERYASDVMLAFKLPFFCEANFDMLARQGPNTRLIHMSREPLSRYVSAKARTTGPRRGIPGVMDFASFQALLPAASLHLAQQAAARHPGHVHFATYEGLRSGRATMEPISRFLEVAWDDVLLRQTLHGFSQTLPSAFGFRNEGGERDDNRRAAAANTLTSQEELAYVALLDATAHGRNVEFHELRKLGACAFVDDTDETRALRKDFLDSRLNHMLDANASKTIAQLVRGNRLNVM